MNHNQTPSNDPLAARVLERIESQHLHPRPRYAFVLENWFFWSVGALAVILGAFAAAATLFEFANAGWRFYTATHANFLTFLLQVVPFLWLLALVALVAIGYANIRHTRHGYRYPLWLIVLGAVLTSLVLGGALFAAGFGEPIDESIGDHPPFYRPIVAQERDFWAHPGSGVLGGTVLAVAPDDSSFVLQDWKGSEWQIDTGGLSSADLSVLAQGNAVRVVGVPTDATSTFHACFIFPWQTVGGRTGGPLSAAASTSVASGLPSERIPSDERNQECRGIRPYNALHALPGY